MTGIILRVCILIASCVALMAGAALARPPYDGSWSVVFYTRVGACEAGYRVGIIIQNGVIYPEGGGINFNGRVSSKGAVSAKVSSGDQYASGSGRLGRSSGSGTWRGQGSRGSCSGTWAAERRG